MNILQLCTKIPYPPKDGGAKAVFAISNGLAEQGYNITIIAVNTPKHYISEGINNKVPANLKIIPLEIDTTTKIINAIINLIFSSLPYRVKRFYHRSGEKKIEKMLQNSKFDIVQFEGVYLGVYLPIIRKNSQAKIGLRAHNVEYLLWNEIEKNTTNFLKRIFLKIENRKLKRFEIALSNKVDFIIPITEKDSNTFKSFSLAKSLVIPYGIDIKSEELKTIGTKNNFDLSYIGALDWIPNQDALLWFIEQIWPSIIEELPDIRFHIAGRNAPKSIDAKLKSIQNINFHGEIDDADNFIQQYSAMLVPLLSGSGMRVKIIQAMALGVPVIASSKAMEGIPVIHKKNILIANTPGEFVYSIKKLSTDQELYNQIKKEGQKLIQSNFSNQALIKQLINFYQEK